jgi:acetyltransferase EpsM
MVDDLREIRVPLINPNEPESLLADLLVAEGELVKPGQVLASFETTKSTFELTAEAAGFVRGLKFSVGDTVRAGERLCYLTASEDQVLPLEKVLTSPEKTDSTKIIPGGLRITQPALALAREHYIDLNSLPKDKLITENMLRDLTTIEKTPDDFSALLIYGGGGHAKSLIDLIRAEDRFQIIGIIDDGIPAGSLILGVPVLGGGELLHAMRRRGIFQAVNAVGGIGSIAPRLAVYQRLSDSGFNCITVIHHLAYVELTASVSDGCQVFFNAYIGSEVKVGFGSIINTSAIVSHDCELGDYVNISPGAILAGAVRVGERSLIGMGATINLGVTIGPGARIGNSAVVKADVPENGIVRAGGIWPDR